jgi:hypothetical protein
MKHQDSLNYCPLGLSKSHPQVSPAKRLLHLCRDEAQTSQLDLVEMLVSFDYETPWPVAFRPAEALEMWRGWDMGLLVDYISDMKLGEASFERYGKKQMSANAVGPTAAHIHSNTLDSLVQIAAPMGFAGCIPA